MCGIFGVFRLRNPLPSGIEAIVQVGTNAVAHRGPDGFGLSNGEHVAFGHRRLSIIDPTASGSQPMESASGRFVLTYNGEIYNYQEIATELRSLGWSQRGESDTEVLLAAVDRWGLKAVLERLDGMFAFAIHDRRTQQVHLVRDRFGEKPLHYFTQGDLVWFGSEIKSLEKVPGFSTQIDSSSLLSYLRLGYVPGQATIYSAVRRVQPATCTTWSIRSGHCDTETWWSPMPNTELHAAPLLELLDQSVRRRMISDRPLGAFLSGGVDSSLVCALAARHVSGSLRTYTMAWEEREYDESQQAARVSSAIGSSHTEISLGRKDVVASVAELAGVFDEPFADSSILPSYLVSKQIRRNEVVALSGDGGDELFGGYNRHKWLPRVAKLGRVPYPIRATASSLLSASSNCIAALLAPMPLERRPRLLDVKIRKLARALRARNLIAAFESTVAIEESVGHGFQIPAGVRSDLLSNDPDQRLRTLRLLDILNYLPDDILHKVDRSTMACGLESRAPFLQHQVAACALAMGSSDLFDDVGGKKPLRAILRQMLPKVSFDAPKTGFSIPLGSLLREELYPMLSDAVTSFQRRGLPVDFDYGRALDRFGRGDDSFQTQLWSVLAFELWGTGRSLTCSEQVPE